MPANKYALLRYRIIDRCLRNPQRPYPSKEDLRYACEEALYGSDGEHISMSTIDKDLWAMRNEGELGFYAPIKFSKEKGGYCYEDPDYTISELPLTDDDLDTIQSAARTLLQFRDVPLFREFDTAIEKILDRMKISAADENRSEHAVIQFERTQGYRGSEFLSDLFKAAKNDLEVYLIYRKFNSEDSDRRKFDPYLLKEYRGRWYVIGRDHRSGDLRTYGLDRVVSLELGAKQFVRDKRFDVQAFFKHAMGITVHGEAPAKVRLKFTEKLAPYVLSQPIHASQRIIEHNENRLVVELEVLKTVELVTLILGFGSEVVVLGPKDLQNEVKESLKKCLQNYPDGA
jgi:predicted DNA-binding transcriptional regulator YafY